MSDTPNTPAETSADASQVQAPAPAAPVAPATPVEPAKTEQKVEITPEIKALIDAAFAKGREKAETAAVKTAEERIAALEAAAMASETAAKNAIVTAAAAGTHNAALVIAAVSGDIADLTSADADAIKAKVDAFLAANPYLVKTDTAPVVPAIAPTPGLGAGAPQAQAVSAGAMTDAEYEAVTSEQLAADEQLFARYVAESARRNA